MVVISKSYLTLLVLLQYSALLLSSTSSTPPACLVSKCQPAPPPSYALGADGVNPLHMYGAIRVGCKEDDGTVPLTLDMGVTNWEVFPRFTVHEVGWCSLIVDVLMAPQSVSVFNDKNSSMRSRKQGVFQQKSRLFTQMTHPPSTACVCVCVRAWLPMARLV